MDQTSDQIEADIQGKRDALRSNLDELENKVKSVGDWRRHFEKHPAAIVAAAIGVGALVAIMSRGRNRPRVRTMPLGEVGASAGPSRSSELRPEGVMRQTWNPIKGALIGAAVSRATVVLEHLLPRFQEQLKKNGSAKRGTSRSAGDPDPESSNHVQGEGDYQAADRYRSDVQRFVETADIERAARDAAPQNRQESAEMAAAEEAGRHRAKPA